MAKMPGSGKGLLAFGGWGGGWGDRDEDGVDIKRRHCKNWVDRGSNNINETSNSTGENGIYTVFYGNTY